MHESRPLRSKRQTGFPRDEYGRLTAPIFRRILFFFVSPFFFKKWAISLINESRYSSPKDSSLKNVAVSKGGNFSLPFLLRAGRDFSRPNNGASCVSAVARDPKAYGVTRRRVSHTTVARPLLISLLREEVSPIRLLSLFLSPSTRPWSRIATLIATLFFLPTADELFSLFPVLRRPVSFP